MKIYEILPSYRESTSGYGVIYGGFYTTREAAETRLEEILRAHYADDLAWQQDLHEDANKIASAIAALEGAGVEVPEILALSHGDNTKIWNSFEEWLSENSNLYSVNELESND